MANISLVTWSLQTTHLYLDKEVILSNSIIVPKGTLCGSRPKKKGQFKMSDGTSFDMLTIKFGETDHYFTKLSFCKNCHRKAIKYHTNKVADELGLPAIITTRPTSTQ